MVLRAPCNKEGRLAIKETSRNVRFTGDPTTTGRSSRTKPKPSSKHCRPLVAGAKETLEAAAAYQATVAKATIFAVVAATPKAKKVVCTEGQYEIGVKSPFNAEFVAELKTAIPFMIVNGPARFGPVRMCHREIVRGLLAKHHSAPSFEVEGLLPPVSANV